MTKIQIILGSFGYNKYTFAKRYSLFTISMRKYIFAAATAAEMSFFYFLQSAQRRTAFLKTA